MIEQSPKLFKATQVNPMFSNMKFKMPGIQTKITIHGYKKEDTEYGYDKEKNQPIETVINDRDNEISRQGHSNSYCKCVPCVQKTWT